MQRAPACRHHPCNQHSLYRQEYDAGDQRGSSTFPWKQESGGFAAMLLLESVLEHAQPWVLVIALFFDPNFTSVLLKLLHQVCPICCRPKIKLTCDLVRNPHVLDSVPPAASDSDGVLN